MKLHSLLTTLRCWGMWSTKKLRKYCHEQGGEMSGLISMLEFFGISRHVKRLDMHEWIYEGRIEDITAQIQTYVVTWDAATAVTQSLLTDIPPQVVSAILRCDNSTASHVTELASEFNDKPSSWTDDSNKVLNALREYPNGARAQDLATGLLIPSARITSILRTIERDTGLVYRVSGGVGRASTWMASSTDPIEHKRVRGEDRIVACVDAHPGLTAADIGERIGMSRQTTINALRTMHARGLINRDGKGTCHDPYRWGPLTSEVVQVEVEKSSRGPKVTSKNILACVEAHPGITTPEISTLTGIPYSQIGGPLEVMRKHKLVERSGDGVANHPYAWSVAQ